SDSLCTSRGDRRERESAWGHAGVDRGITDNKAEQQTSLKIFLDLERNEHAVHGLEIPELDLDRQVRARVDVGVRVEVQDQGQECLRVQVYIHGAEGQNQGGDACR